ncbi:MAG: Inorganic pyrophosphatase [Tenericutes bacterium ADurb.Bin239]|nr:MAG: Inorganic pyrophosphatase [Tenericutes bacterium ADurb.Bin239]
MNIWHDMNPDRIMSERFDAVIEISRGQQSKYELDKETGLIRLDRVLYTSTHYPQNYGFIPRTYAGDDDPLDVLILCSQPLVPMTIVTCIPIGAIKMIDTGEMDEKIIAIAANDPTYASYGSAKEIPQHVFQEIRHFFQVYKTLEGKETVVHHIQGRERAIKIIDEAIVKYNEVYGNRQKADK